MSVITVEDRIEVLEGIAKSYLAELDNALIHAKIQRSALGPSSQLEIKVNDLQNRVDSLTHKMKRIGLICQI